MPRFEVVVTGWISGMGRDHRKHRVRKRFEGGNGKREFYDTEDPDEVAILMACPHSHLVETPPTPREPRGVPRDEKAETPSRTAPEAAAVQKRETPAPAPPRPKYSRNELIKVLEGKHYQNDLLPMAATYGVSSHTEKGRSRKKKDLVEALADAYIEKNYGGDS